MKWVSYRIATWIGWRIRGTLPDLAKMVIVGAPHTSNWDFFLFLAALHYFDIEVKFLAKRPLFRRPFGWFFRRVGGIPVGGPGAGGIVREAVTAFDADDRMILVIAPEGTRRAAPKWRSGFFEIAQSANVPIVLAGVDGAHKVLTIGPVVQPDEDRNALMDRIRAFYADQTGIKPKGKGPVRLANESAVS